MASIKCANCKNTHFSVDEVRECFWYETAAGQAYLDAQAKAEWEAERRAEQYWETRGVDTYTGSEEEARDRYFDFLRETEAETLAIQAKERAEDEAVAAYKWNRDWAWAN